MDFKGRNKVTPEFNMSSMTDIVFLLLIFFMLASTLVSVNAIDILLPKASGKTENKKSVSVSIKKDLTYYIDQRRVGESVLESELLADLSSEASPTIVLRGCFDSLGSVPAMRRYLPLIQHEGPGRPQI